LGDLPTAPGPHEAFFRNTLTTTGTSAHLGEWELCKVGTRDAISDRDRLVNALLKEFDAHFQNEQYVILAVADYRTWQSVDVSSSEKSNLVALEKQWGVAVPPILGIATSFHLVKKCYFDIPAEKRSSDITYFVNFYRGLCSDEGALKSIRTYAAIVLLCSGDTADAERSISFLNLIVGALRTRLTWDGIRRHLIGKEDMDPETLPFEKLAHEWSQIKARRRWSKAEKRKERKDVGCQKKRRKVATEVVRDGLAALLEKDSDTSSSSGSSSSSASSSSSSSGSSSSDSSSSSSSDEG
jgi:uncharacterized membrane protein YgcG